MTGAAGTEPIEGRDRGRFYRVGSDRPAVWMMQRLDAGKYSLTEPVEYLACDGHTYVLPVAGYPRQTDFASIPPMLTWLVPRDGRHTPAAILHDAFIGGTKGEDYTTDEEFVSDERADYLFREAMQHARVGFLRRWSMWAAVSLRTLLARPDGKGTDRLEAFLLALVAVPWVVVTALLALDVPDFEHEGWTLPWFGRRPWLEELGHGLVVILAGAALCALVTGLVLRRTRGLGVGAIAGLIIGFLGLPIVASAVGGSGYWVLDNLVTRIKEGHAARPLATPTSELAGTGPDEGQRAAPFGT